MIAFDSSFFGAVASFDCMRGNAGASAQLTNSAYTDTETIIGGYFALQSIKIADGWLQRNLSAGAASTLYTLYYVGANYYPVASLGLDTQVAKYVPTGRDEFDGTGLVRQLSLLSSDYAVDFSRLHDQWPSR